LVPSSSLRWAHWAPSSASATSSKVLLGASAPVEEVAALPRLVANAAAVGEEVAAQRLPLLRPL
jgi:hypothetical protein